VKMNKKSLLKKSMDREIEEFVSQNSIDYIPLDSLGITRGAFEKDAALIIISFLREEIIPVLGIDVYILKDNAVMFPKVYNNWYSIRLPNEPMGEYAERTCQEAKSFLRSYNSNEGLPVFDIYVYDFCQHYIQ